MLHLIFMVAAGFSVLFSLFLWFSGQTDTALFVGLWVPSILVLSLIFKKAAREAKSLVQEAVGDKGNNPTGAI